MNKKQLLSIALLLSVTNMFGALAVVTPVSPVAVAAGKVAAGAVGLTAVHGATEGAKKLASHVDTPAPEFTHLDLPAGFAVPTAKQVNEQAASTKWYGLHKRVAPVLNRAKDGFNKGLDYVKSVTPAAVKSITAEQAAVATSAGYLGNRAADFGLSYTRFNDGKVNKAVRTAAATAGAAAAHFGMPFVSATYSPYVSGATMTTAAGLAVYNSGVLGKIKSLGAGVLSRIFKSKQQPVKKDAAVVVVEESTSVRLPNEPLAGVYVQLRGGKFHSFLPKANELNAAQKQMLKAQFS